MRHGERFVVKAAHLPRNDSEALHTWERSEEKQSRIRTSSHTHRGAPRNEDDDFYIVTCKRTAGLLASLEEELEAEADAEKWLALL